MLKLSILRHAKSSWDDPSLEDFDRPLAKRGATAAADMGVYLLRENLRPELIFCSGAVRTRATVALLLPELGMPLPEVVYDDELYLAMPRELMGIIRKANPGAQHIMIVGHNPGLHALALELSGDGPREDMLELATKFPTCALAVIEFVAESWIDVQAARGRLERFIAPRRLP